MTTAATQIERQDGRVELVDTRRVEQSPLYNDDLAPVPLARRTWTTYNYAALWISMAHCIPTYMLSAGLMAAGMSWAQALFTVALGNTIVLVPILLNSHPGTRYGIPFPVFARAAYGTIGSNVPALMRAVVACGWFGIQAWIGGEALNTFFASVIPGWHDLLGAGFGGHSTTEWLSFLLFWTLNIVIVYRGMDLLRRVENWAAPFVLVMTSLLLAWAVTEANGFGPLLSQAGKFTTMSEFLPVFVPSLTAMIGFWATLSLNMPDFTRFGRSQREQVVGQTVALPTTMFAFAAMGVLITSATAIIYHEVIWDPIKLIARFSNPLVIAISMFTAVVATLAVNIAANVVSPANDFANAFPRLITFSTGGLITGILGILIQPWRLLADPSGYIFSWLLGYSGGLGSIAGVLIADYWIVRKRNLALEDLYLANGRYGRWNAAGIVATVAGCAAAWGGLIVPVMRPLYDYAWFVGFGVAAIAYLALRRRTTVPLLAAILPALAIVQPPSPQTAFAMATMRTAVGNIDESALREYTGVYRWAPDAFLYLQLWNEFTGFDKPSELVAFDETGEVRTLYPSARDKFFTGPGMAVSAPPESHIEFQRNQSGRVVSLTWTRNGAPPRSARLADIEKREDVKFAGGGIRLAGTLMSPTRGGKHPAVVLVHGSGAENREYMLPWARFLIRRGVAVLGYDKRGVGGSTGDWNTASFDQLADDVVGAVEYLKGRSDIDGTQIGLLGISQAGWIMPLAAVRTKDVAFLISISGAGIPAAETTIDQARNEMTMTGMPPQTVDAIIALMRLQYEYARTGNGWEDYVGAREKMIAKLGVAPKTIPGTREDPYWQFIRRLYFYDPAPTLRRLQTPTLALWGELDNNVVADKNKSAWEAALKAGGNRDYTLKILPKANHAQWEAKAGSNAETKSLQRFVPEFFTTIIDWLAKRIPGFNAGRTA